jgi:hypothetical protein
LKRELRHDGFANNEYRAQQDSLKTVEEKEISRYLAPLVNDTTAGKLTEKYLPWRKLLRTLVFC